MNAARVASVRPSASRRAARLAWTVLAAVVVAAPAHAVVEYDTRGPLPAERFLPAVLLAGTEWRVEGDTYNDGLFNTYRVASRFGTFQGRGIVGVSARIREILALAELDRASKSDTFAQLAQKAGLGDVATVSAMAAQPRPANPAGYSSAARWVRKMGGAYTPQQGYATTVGSSSGTPAEMAPLLPAEAARARTDDMLAMTAAERTFYARMGVDPYTDNLLLRDVVRSYARIAALQQFGLVFLERPPVPGEAALLPALQQVWRTDPAPLRARNHQALLADGVAEAQAKAFEDNPFLTLTQQTAIVLLLDQLAGVAGREHLVSRTAGVESRQDAADMVQSILLLVLLHQRDRPLSAILPGAMLPVARAKNNRLVATLAADSAFWTEEIANATGDLTLLYQKHAAPGRELWLLGDTTARFTDGMRALGWKVFDRWQPLRPPPQ